MNTTDVQALGCKVSSVSTTGEKTNAGKVLNRVYLLLNISPSSPNPNSGPWGEGGSDALAPLLLPSPKLGRGAGGEGWRGREVLKVRPLTG